MKILEQMYEGKAKQVFATEDPEIVMVHYKDDATAGDGAKKGTIRDKGVVNNRLSNALMQKLEKEGIPTHYVQELNDRDTLVKKVQIVPLEVIIRNVAAGSFSKRFGVVEGTPLKMPTIEFSYKNDDLHDPMINHYHALALGLATQEEIDQIIGQLDRRLCCVIMDADDEIAAFGIAMPSVSKAMQKAKGSLFPFGWYHVLRAMKDFTCLDLMLVGAAPKWQNTGVSALIHGMMAQQAQECGARWALANPQIETNTAVNVWTRYDHELWMRRRCWIKKIK